MANVNMGDGHHFSCVQLFATPWPVTRKAPLSVGFSRQECWSGLPCPPPGDLPDPGIEPASLTSSALAGRFFTTSVTKLGYPDKHICLELYISTYLMQAWRRKCQHPRVFLPGKSHGQRSLVGYSPWGHKESDMPEHTHTQYKVSEMRTRNTAGIL